ncbi:MAG: hypothetical protein IKK06_06845 [Clostridia bacterium]|nr:hypothetical protein [Clostridia bacterium]
MSFFKWIKKVFEPSVDKPEQELKEAFRFLLEDYGFSYAKLDLGDLEDRNGKRIFYGPLYAYQFYNDRLCIHIVELVQRHEIDVYVTEKRETDQHRIFSGEKLPSHLAANWRLLAAEIKTEIAANQTIFGKHV